jgi:ADP-ribose pyrophosphatase YjhB (NUDIX family)
VGSVGSGNCVIVVLHVGRTKASYIKLVLQSEPRTGKYWCRAGIVFPHEEHVDEAVRELFEETGLTGTVDDLNLLSGGVVRFYQVPSRLRVLGFRSCPVCKR